MTERDMIDADLGLAVAGGRLDPVRAHLPADLAEPNFLLVFEVTVFENDFNINKQKEFEATLRSTNLDPGIYQVQASITKNKETHILFVRPGKVAANSKAKKVAKELEDDVIKTIEVAITS